jgi:hypothetical protein
MGDIGKGVANIGKGHHITLTLPGIHGALNQAVFHPIFVPSFSIKELQ